MTHQAKTISYDIRVRIFWTLVGLSVLAFGVYIYSINMTIRNTALRQELQAQVAQESAELSELEFAYITKRNEIGIELASTFGLKEVRNPAYASRARNSAFTFNTVRR